MPENTHLISTVSGFEPTENPKVLPRSLSISGYVLLGLIVAFIFTLFAEINKRLNGI
jgi:hypothetical protein